jgi:hypothetical protein
MSSPKDGKKPIAAVGASEGMHNALSSTSLSLSPKTANAPAFFFYPRCFMRYDGRRRPRALCDLG